MQPIHKETQHEHKKDRHTKHKRNNGLNQTNTDRHTDRQTGKQTDTQTDRQERPT